MIIQLRVLCLIVGMITLNACGGTAAATRPPQATAQQSTEFPQSSRETAVNLGSHSIAVGATIPISAMITSADQVAGGFLKIEFDNSVIAIDNVTAGDIGSPTTVIDNERGFVSIAAAQATAIGKDQAILAVINVRGVSAGEANLQISEVELNDAAGNVMTPKAENGLVSVQ
jgi:hypothetical protein